MGDNINMINLQYFTANSMYNKLFEKEEQEKDANLPYSKEDFRFYKKRILQLVKDLVKGKANDASINSSFNEFVVNAIEHFRFMDKADMIQNDNPSNNTTSPVKKNGLPPIPESNDQVYGNQLLYKEQVAPISKRIDDFVVRKSEVIQERIIPQQKQYNLKTKELRKKGVEKKQKKDKKKKKENKKM